MSGKSEWVTVNYALSIFNLTNELGQEALNLFILGTAVFMISYIAFRQERSYIIDHQSLFSAFLSQQKSKVIVLFGAFMFVNGLAKVALGNGPAAYGNGYAFLFGLAIGGIILLMYLIYRHIPSKGQLSTKLLFLGLFAIAAYLSFNASLRFQFLSWAVAIGILIVKDRKPTRKAVVYAIGGVCVALFSLAGVLRSVKSEGLDFNQALALSLERNDKADDQNMLDGFMMVLQVYPQHLNYSYGMEHVEILMRPVPRVLWPEKPVGGYANKLGLNDNFGGVTIGISQSIYGTFYGEGGTFGIILFSILYGYLFTRLFRYANRYNSDMRYLLKGVIIASTIPLLRGGDLPGIIAFIGMSYWPIFIFLYQYNQFLKKAHLSSKAPQKVYAIH